MEKEINLEEILSIVIEASKEIIRENDLPLVEIEEGTELLGENGALDSMGIVELVSDLEMAIEDSYGKTISLFDDEMLSDVNGPFESPKLLSKHICSVLLKEK